MGQLWSIPNKRNPIPTPKCCNEQHSAWKWQQGSRCQMRSNNRHWRDTNCKVSKKKEALQRYRLTAIRKKRRLFSFLLKQQPFPSYTLASHVSSTFLSTFLAKQASERCLGLHLVSSGVSHVTCKQIKVHTQNNIA